MLLLPSARPLVYGLMIPEFLGKQLLTAEPGPGLEPKVQRNTQAEILAIVTGILTWAESLRGKDLLIVTDSFATMGNILGGSSSDAHSQELIAFLWFIIAVFEVRAWVEWLPSKQNPGDPFSRPLTHTRKMLLRLWDTSMQNGPHRCYRPP